MPHEHCHDSPPTNRCEDPDAWALVDPPKRVEWCGEMTEAWYLMRTGQLIPRARYRCSSLFCEGCGPERVSSYLARFPAVWPEDKRLFLAEPIGRRWKVNWDYTVESLRKTRRIEVDYLTVRRRDFATGKDLVFLWASIPVSYAYTAAGWESYDKPEALRTLRDQLCLPGPIPRHFPPPTSTSWKLPSKGGAGGKLPAGWKQFVIDQDAYAAEFEKEAIKYEREFGVRPDRDVDLPDPQAWQDRLSEAGILLAGG